jgi:hypothetical protein
MVETASILPQEVHPSRSAVPPVRAEEEIALMDLLLPIFRNPRLFLALLFAFSIPGILVFIFAPRKYEVTAIIRIGKVPSSFTLDSIAYTSDPDQLLNSFTYFLETKQNFSPRVKSAKKIESKLGNKTDLIRIIVTGKDPVSAYRFLQEIIAREILIPERSRFQEKMDLIKKQIFFVQKNLESAYKLRAEYESALSKDKSGSTSHLLHAHQLASLYEQIFSWEQTLTQLKLLFLSPQVYPTQIIAPILFPTTPSFPNPFLTFAVTFVIAFFLAYAGCFFRDSLRLKRKSLG